MELLHYLETTNHAIYFLSVKSHSYIASLFFNLRQYIWVILQPFYLLHKKDSTIIYVYCLCISALALKSVETQSRVGNEKLNEEEIDTARPLPFYIVVTKARNFLPKYVISSSTYN